MKQGTFRGTHLAYYFELYYVGLYGDSINEMSWLVDETIAALKKFDLEENTLVFFISDHGPEVELCIEGGSTAGLRGKISCHGL